MYDQTQGSGAVFFSYFTDNSNVQEIFFLSRTGHGVPFSSSKMKPFSNFFSKEQEPKVLFIIMKVKNCLTVVQTLKPKI